MRHTKWVSLSERLSLMTRRMGLEISRASQRSLRLPIEADDRDRSRIESLQPYTMTSSERLWSLINAVNYIVDSKIPGDFVECGVWRGGSVMAMAHALLDRGVTDRTIWLYDTFRGMTPPTQRDIEVSTGRAAASLLATTDIGDGNNVWAHASRSDVEANLRSTGYPWKQFTLVEGDVVETLKTSRPESIALLRLDTDWYESTRAEMETLYPLLVPGGVCILDDYGHWQGARQAVDEYFSEHAPRPYMHVIDFGGRTFIKTNGLFR